MSTILIIEQVLNGLQFGVMLFLMAAGLTLIFGVMGLIYLAHGSLYMVGAFAAAAVAGVTGSFVLALIAALAAAAEAAGLSAAPVGSVRPALRLLSETWRFEPAPRLLIGGSLYLVGDILAQNGTPPA